MGNNINMLFFIFGFNEKYIKFLDMKLIIIIICNGDNGFVRVLFFVRLKLCRLLGNEFFIRFKCLFDLDKRNI